MFEPGRSRVTGVSLTATCFAHRAPGTAWFQQTALKNRAGGQKSEVKGPLLPANTLQLQRTPARLPLPARLWFCQAFP